jgi:hypothetical protein
MAIDPWWKRSGGKGDLKPIEPSAEHFSEVFLAVDYIMQFLHMLLLRVIRFA